MSSTHIKISQFLASYVRTACPMKLSPSCLNLLTICIKLDVNIGLGCLYNNSDDNTRLQHCYIMTVSVLLQEPCNKSDSLIKVVTNCQGLF